MAEPESISSGETANPSDMSLGNRLVNIFVSPSEVLDEIKVSPPNAANWWVPMVLVIIAGIIYTMVVFSQPGIIQGMRDVQDKKMQEQVDAGKMTRQQADQAEAMIEKFMGPTFLKVMGILSVCILSPAMVFFVALIMWLVGVKVLGGNFVYMKAVEAVGLASVISCAASIVAMLLAVIYANLAMTAGPVLLVSHYDPASKLHALLSALDVMSLWFVTVVSVALSRLSGASFLKSALWTYCIWAVFRLGPVLIFGGH
jgi:Yip1 domain